MSECLANLGHEASTKINETNIRKINETENPYRSINSPVGEPDIETLQWEKGLL